MGFDLHFSAVIQATFLLLFFKSPHLASWFACRIVTPAFTKSNWITKVWVMFSNIYPQTFSQANAVGADQVPSMIWKDAVWFDSFQNFLFELLQVRAGPKLLFRHFSAFINFAIFSCPSSSIPTHVTHSLMVYFPEGSTRQCAPIWSDNLQIDCSAVRLFGI